MSGSQVAPDLLAKQTIRPQSIGAGTLNGLAVDTQGYDEAVVVLDTGTFTTGTLDVKVQESADGSSGWTDIAGAAFAQVTSTTDDSVYVGSIRMEGPRLRYLRAVAVVATAACLGAVTIHLGKPVSMPAQSLAFNV
jgi:hypothetical protein